MPLRVILALALLGLVVTAGLWPAPQPPGAGSSRAPLVWDVFLFAAPLLLAALNVAAIRWASMLAVMYGTIGLALDLSTLIQLEAGTSGRLFLLAAISGLLNAIVIVLGGALFLNVRGGRPLFDERRLS